MDAVLGTERVKKKYIRFSMIMYWWLLNHGCCIGY